MRTLNRTVAVIAACCLLTAVPSVAAAERGIAWEPCAGHPTADCGKLRLPVDWAKPWGGKFDLAVARRKAANPSERRGVLLINPGGPGGSGVNFVLNGPHHFSNRVRAQFDLIGFDPRGIGGSSPVLCSREKTLAAPSSYPVNQAEFDKLAKHNRELREDCRRHSGPMVDHADTLSVVHDVDALRRALGERKINYYGISYGTMIGQQYAEQYGEKIRAMIIDGNMDHSLGVSKYVETDARTTEDSFTEWVKWCDRTPSCALHGKDVPKLWDDLLARADRGELVDPAQPDRKLQAADLISRAFTYFYGPSWQSLAEYVKLVDAQQPLKTTAAELVPNAYAAILCEDWEFPMRTFRDYQRLRDIELREAPHMRGGPLSHQDITTCLGWADNKVNNPQHRLNIRHAPAILVTNPIHDPATSYEWAANVHRQARHTTAFVVYEGWGHGAYRKSDCMTKVSDDYLVDLTVPPTGYRCPAVEPPATDALAELPARPTRWQRPV